MHDQGRVGEGTASSPSFVQAIYGKRGRGRPRPLGLQNLGRQRILPQNLVKDRRYAIRPRRVRLDRVRHRFRNSFRDLSEVIHPGAMRNFAEIDVFCGGVCVVLWAKQADQRAFPLTPFLEPLLDPISNTEWDIALRRSRGYDQVSLRGIFKCLARGALRLNLGKQEPMNLKLMLHPKALDEGIAKLPGLLLGAFILAEYCD